MVGELSLDLTVWGEEHMGKLENVVKHSQSSAKPWVGTEGAPASDEEHSTSRREFYSRIPGIVAATLAWAAVPVISHAEAAEPKGSSGAANKRAAYSSQLGLDAAQEEADVPASRQIANGDEQKYSSFIGNYHKGCRITRSPGHSLLLSIVFECGAPGHIYAVHQGI
jgi:hypothetical protein